MFVINRSWSMTIGHIDHHDHDQANTQEEMSTFVQNKLINFF